MSDEFHQSFIPGRWVSIFDLLADLTGAMLVCALWLWNPNFRLSFHRKYLIISEKLKGFSGT
jgi:VanZ family protein